MNQANLKSLKLYDPDAKINALNEETPRRLNKRGSILYHKSLKALQIGPNKLSVVANGVLERFDEYTMKVYLSTYTNCDRTFSQAKPMVLVGMFSPKDRMLTFPVLSYHFSIHNTVRLTHSRHSLFQSSGQNFHPRSVLTYFEHLKIEKKIT